MGNPAILPDPSCELLERLLVKELRESISILKARWPEATVIIGLNILAGIVTAVFRSIRPNLIQLIWLCVVLGLVIVACLLTYGFLRTVYLLNQQKQTLATLLHIGKRFFFRMMGYGLIFFVFYFILAWLVFLVTKRFTSIDTGFLDAVKSTPWLSTLCFALPGLVLIKVQLFVPAIILVLDCGVLESLKSLRKFRLLDSRELIALFCLQAILAFLGNRLEGYYDAGAVLKWVEISFRVVVHYALWLLIATIAVRFVGSLDLARESGAGDSNPEEPCERPTLA